MWEELCGESCVGEAVGELCFIHVCMGGGELCVGTGWEELYGGEGGALWGELCVGLCGELCSYLASQIHSQKCSICYSVACLSDCVAEVVFVVQSSQTL